MISKTTKTEPTGAKAGNARHNGNGKSQHKKASQILQLQQLIHTAGIQPKLTIGKPNDRFEQEADRMADKVSNAPAESVQRMETEKEEEPTVQPKLTIMRSPAPEEEPAVQNQIEEDEPAVQAQMEEEPEVQSQAEEDEPALQPQMEEEPDVQRQAEENEPAVQGQMDEEPGLQSQSEEEEPSIQTQTEEEQALQTKLEKEEPAAQTQLEKEPVLQRKPGGDNNLASSGLESKLNASKTGGHTLPDHTRGQMESHFGSDFSNVRVHTDSDAAQMSRELGAQAFTHGNHVYFNQGKYNPGSSEGNRLIAHELTHTIQQTGGANKKIQRAESTPASNTQNQTEENPTLVDIPEGTFNIATKEMHIRNLPLPAFKFQKGFYKQTPFPLPKKDEGERTDQQRQIWDTNIKENSGEGLDAKLEEMYQQQIPPVDQQGRTQPRYYLKTKQRNIFVIGTPTEIKNRVVRPFWDPSGKYQLYHVDHKIEIQLGGEDKKEENLWLLSKEANEDSGSEIKKKKDQKIRAILNAGRQNEQLKTQMPTLEEIRRAPYTIWIDKVSEGPKLKYQSISADEAKKGKTLEGLEAVTGEDLTALRGSANELVIFTNPYGGGIRRIPWEPNMTAKTDMSKVSSEQREIGKNFFIDQVNYVKGSGGSITGRAFKNKNQFIDTTPLTFKLQESPAVDYGGFISATSVRNEANRLLKLKQLSPIAFEEIILDPQKGLRGRGKILPSVPIISKAEIEVVIDGNLVELRKTFTAGEFEIPPPFEISEANLTVFAGIRGLGIEGRVFFGIQHVGEGFIGAAASTSGGFELAGEFNFDSKLFDPAKISVEYKDETFRVGGEIGIPAGKVRGIKSARITANYSEGNFSADGTADLDIPGIEQGQMSVNYSDEGFSISGNFQLSSDIPGIRSGSIEATVSKQAGQEDYNVVARGTAQPDIPGLNSSLTVAYDNGIITIEGRAAYARGLLSGNVDIGVTNRPIGDDGQPSGDPDESLRVYGSGNLTVKLTPWLEATAGVRFTPEGEIEVRGEIALPSSVEIFPRKSIEKSIFRMPTIEIPLFAIPLGPRSIGLVATIGGGLNAEAGIGPGRITDLGVSVAYNPARGDGTNVDGTGRFIIPADAGLRLYARAGIGISIAIARVSGNIEVGGELGLEGAAEAGVDVNWSPAQGLELNAFGEIYVQPKFRFDVSAVLEATLDLWLFDLSKEWRKTLAEFEYGPDLRFGVRFPVHYKEGEPFDISLNDVEFITPEVDIGSIVKGLGRRVIG